MNEGMYMEQNSNTNISLPTAPAKRFREILARRRRWDGERDNSVESPNDNQCNEIVLPHLQGNDHICKLAVPEEIYGELMTKQYVSDHIYVDESKVGCSVDVFCKDLKRQAAELVAKGWKDITVDTQGYSKDFILAGQRPETDKEYANRLKKEALKNKNEEEQLAKEKEFYLILKQKFEPNEENK